MDRICQDVVGRCSFVDVLEEAAAPRQVSASAFGSGPSLAKPVTEIAAPSELPPFVKY